MTIIETLILSILTVMVVSIFCYSILQMMEKMHEHEYRMEQAYYTQRMFENEQVPDTNENSPHPIEKEVSDDEFFEEIENGQISLETVKEWTNRVDTEKETLPKDKLGYVDSSEQNSECDEAENIQRAWK